MDSFYIIALALGGAAVGGIAGAFYGAATDKSDFPVMLLFTAPVGALSGGLAGVVAGAFLFA